VPGGLAQRHDVVDPDARRLGIGRSTLYRKVKELGLDKRAS